MDAEGAEAPPPEKNGKKKNGKPGE